MYEALFRICARDNRLRGGMEGEIVGEVATWLGETEIYQSRCPFKDSTLEGLQTYFSESMIATMNQRM